MAQATIFVALFLFQLDLLQCYNDKLQKPNISPECESMGICASVDNYPKNLVKGLIDKLKSENTIFNYDKPQPTIFMRFNDNDYDEDEDEDDEDSSETKPWRKIKNTIFNYYKPQSKIFTRFNEMYDEDGFGFRESNNRRNIIENRANFHVRHSNFGSHQVLLRPSFNNRVNKKKPLSLCETVPQFVPPQAAKDINGNWQFIINDPEEPVQVFRIETCRQSMGHCSKNIGFMPGYSGKCIQKMMFREILYVNEANETGTAYFEVPTCCSCTLFKKDYYK